jgi:histidyl-tRNA synthetase
MFAEDEYVNNQVIVKNMVTGVQSKCDVDLVDKEITRQLNEEPPEQT